MPIAANARRSVRLDAAIDTAASAAEIATPDSTIRPSVASQSPSPVGPDALDRVADQQQQRRAAA